MTEQEAKKKWCPLLQIITQIRWNNTDTDSKKCIASGCMLWVWDADYSACQGGIQIPDKSTTEGHCGLAR